MDKDRWHRIESLFDQALALADEERDPFLRRACADAPDLLGEVQALIASARDTGGTLRRAVAAEAGQLAPDPASAMVGRRIGRFRLVQLIGEGGMGTVYLAERETGEFAHSVAIKLLPRAMASPLAVARLRDERRILAALKHPGIVRLLDGGSTEDQQPYLVMEYVEGTAITTYARAHQLTVPACVALIRKVCTAMQYAHQNMVVHRDLKPGNILVDAEGEPKILDFGIAKLLAPIPGLDRESRTHTGSALFTPQYASPEQARGEDISTATDVYALGAVLYELVTGRPPHLATGSALDMLRTICERDPELPSAVAPPDHRRVLEGDLDNILLKALHKEPGRRYPSMEHFFEDLGRFLGGLPVSARTATLGYRARKFIRRHQAAVLAAGLMLTVLVSATAVSLWQARRADDEAELAQVARAHAVEAAERASQEALRAREAEARVQRQLDQLQAEQTARAKAEAAARAKASEAELSREQLQLALDKAKIERMLAEEEALKAREAEARAQAATHSENSTREECFRALDNIPAKPDRRHAGP